MVFHFLFRMNWNYWVLIQENHIENDFTIFLLDEIKKKGVNLF